MTQISLSFIVGLCVASALVLAGIALFVAGRVILRRDLTADSLLFGPPVKWAGVVLVVATVGVSAWAFFPYRMEYHQFRHVQGTVQDVQSRFLGDGKSTSQNFAVRLNEDGQTYRCDDSRCSLVKPGDHISLWCIREWQYASTSGYQCRFDSTAPA